MHVYVRELCISKSMSACDFLFDGTKVGLLFR